ncbi:hypothetical protein [Nocardioides jensenii]|uniref:hypothetical protein n=1 Tax=Nocardioides jensenii TaxID=1843 RepID=UPI000AA75745|nr:hypothetical protein [Nocardioides jensenii]
MFPLRKPTSKSALIALGTVGALIVLTPTTAVAARLIDSSDIKNQSIQSWDIAPDGIGRSELRSGSVGWDQLDTRTRARIVALAGKDGRNGTNGADGEDGATGANGADGADGLNGADGTNGLNGADGADGTNGSDGADGADGADGPSAYDLAVANGFSGTVPAWLVSLVGATGPQGVTGPAGEDGATGPAGPAGPAGPPGPIGATGPAGPVGPAGGGTVLKDGNGAAIGKIQSVTRNSVTVLTSNGYMLAIGWDGSIAPAQAYYTGANCTGTAYLNSGGPNPSWLYAKTLVYLGSANTLAVPAALDGSGAAANTGVNAAAIDNPTCGTSVGSRNGWELKPTTAANTGLPAGVVNQIATPLSVS